MIKNFHFRFIFAVLEKSQVCICTFLRFLNTLIIHHAYGFFFVNICTLDFSYMFIRVGNYDGQCKMTSCRPSTKTARLFRLCLSNQCDSATCV